MEIPYSYLSDSENDPENQLLTIALDTKNARHTDTTIDDIKEKFPILWAAAKNRMMERMAESLKKQWTEEGMNFKEAKAKSRNVVREYFSTTEAWKLLVADRIVKAVSEVFK